MENPNTLKPYEGAFIFEDVPDHALFEKRLKHAESLVAKSGGTVLGTQDLGRRVLGYPLSGKTEGRVVIVDFTLPTDQMETLREALRLCEGLARANIFVKTPPRPPTRRQKAEHHLGVQSHVSKP